MYGEKRSERLRTNVYFNDRKSEVCLRLPHKSKRGMVRHKNGGVAIYSKVESIRHDYKVARTSTLSAHGCQYRFALSSLGNSEAKYKDV